ncbi:MAG: Rieske 2Fe-2S domain-containing protein [Candidatus Tectomicrobia bacterium]|nr:Rieske 2Fe-2S domain-containing protein [Candidatus Tectomicrobia bacterium]
MGTFRKVAGVEEIPPGEAKAVFFEGEDVGLFNVNGAYYAVDNLCPHAGGALNLGTVEGTRVTCPWHAWVFDLRDGRCVAAAGIAPEKISPSWSLCSYQVRVEGRDILMARRGEREGKPVP